MLTQSKETRNAWRASQRTLDIKVTIDGKTYGATDINSLKYDSGAYNGDTFAIGSTYSNTVQIEFSHLIEGLKLGMKVLPSIGIKTASGYVYEPLGVFVISNEIKMDRNNNLTTVSASDRFCGLEGAYVSKLTYPAKVLDVITEICAQSGVKANTDDLARLPHQADLPAPITGQSYRKALGWIAQLYVGYALFDRQGLFTIRTISEPNYELDPSQYEQAGLTKNEAVYKINGIQCQVTLTTKTRDGESTEETKTYQAGDATGSQIKLENNIMTPQRLNDIWEQLKDLTFYPFSLNWFGNPAVEAGDWLRLEDKQGNSFVVPNSSYTLDFNGGLSATSKADQTTSSDQMVPWQGSVAQTIKELQLRRSPDGTVVFPPSVTEPPTNAKFNDVWFKKNGNSTELWIFEKQDDGSGKWIRKDLSDDEIKKKVADAQQGLNQAKADIINNKQKADTDIENLNKSIEANKKVADKSLQKLNDSVTNLQGQYDNNVVPNLNKVMADASDALQKYISAQNSIADLTKQAQEQGKDIADVSNTVKGLNINYANLAGDVNSTKVDVKGLQTTVGTANGDIAQLKLDAQNLQIMLAGKVDNTTYMNFVNLTNQALNARLTASDLNGYAKSVDVQATANGLRVDLNAVTGKLNNMIVGNRNLIRNSAFPNNNDFWEPTAKVATHLFYYQGKKSLFVINNSTNSEITSCSAYFPIKRNTDYVFSFKGFQSWNVSSYDVWLLTRKAGETAAFTDSRPIILGQQLSNAKLQYVKDVVVNSGDADEACIRFDNNGSSNSEDSVLFFGEVQLEEGNKSTAWNASPEDEKQRVDDITSQLSAKISATNEKFSSYYTRAETDDRTNSAKNDAINTIRNDGKWQGLSNILTNSGFLQSADGFLQKVQQTTIPMFSGGGINLLKNSAGPFQPQADGHIDNYEIYSNSTIELVQGQQYTISGMTNGIFSGEHNPSIESDNVVLWIISNVNLTGINQIVSDGNTAKGTTFTWNYPSGTYLLKVNTYHPVASNKIKAWNIKIELGTVRTPWVPNSSDLATQIKYTELAQTIDGLKSTVSNNYGQLQSQISQSASAIQDNLIDKINGVQNLVTTTANGLNARITNLHVGSTNLIQDSNANIDNAYPWDNTSLYTHPFYYNNTKKMFVIQTSGNGELTASSNWFNFKPGTEYTLSFQGFQSWNMRSYDVWLLMRHSGETGSWTASYPIINGERLSNAHCDKVIKTFTTPSDYDEAFLRFDNNGSQSGQNEVFFFNEVKLEEGTVATDWSPSPGDTDKRFVEVNATIDGLRSTVSGNYGDLQNQISQTTQATRNEINDRANKLQGQLTLQANNFNVALNSLQIGGTNLVRNSGNFQNTDHWFFSGNYVNNASLRLGKHPFWKNGKENLLQLTNTSSTQEVLASSDYFDVKPNTTYTIGFWVFHDVNLQDYDVYFLGRKYGSTNGFDLSVEPIAGAKASAAHASYVAKTFNTGNSDEGYIRFDNNAVLNNGQPSTLYLADIKVEEGDKATAWSPAPEDQVAKNQILAQINMSAGTTLIQNDKIYMDSSSTIFSGKAFIPDAAITNISADKITAGTLDAGRINVINLNANNITTGTINGQNLKINLDTGNVEFQHGHIHNFSNSVDIDLDQNYISVSSWSTKAMLKNGELQLIQPQLFDLSSDPYFRLYNGGSGSDWSAAYLEGRSGIFISPKGYKGNSVLDTLGILGQNTWAGFYTGYENGGALSPTSIGGADKGVVIHGGAKLTQTSNIFSGDGGTALADTPHIHIGTDGSGRFGGNRIVIEGEYVHVPTAWRHTTGDAPNLFIANDGALVRSTSASKYKTEIHRDYSTNYGDRLLELPTATWIDKGQKERYQAGQRNIKPKKYFGMIAEDLADAGLDLLVSKNADGEIEGIQYERIAPALIPVIRKLKKKVQQLEEKLNE